MTTILTEASNQWATRPADQRFWGIPDLLESSKEERYNSKEYQRKTASLIAMEYEGQLMLSSGQTPTTMTNWGFTQLSRYVSAPPSYLQELPPRLAAECLNEGLRRRKEDVVNLYVRQDLKTKSLELRSFLTDSYSRLYNNDVIETGLKRAVEYGWMVPPGRPSSNDDDRARPATLGDIIPGQENFGLAIKPGDMIAPAGVYKSDRDMFIFMVNPDRVYDDGNAGLMRGFFLWNSEVGAGAFKLKTFLLENVCGNHICWNASDVKEIKVVHKGKAIDGVSNNVRLTMKAYADSGESNERKMITSAKSFIIGKTKDEVIKWIFGNKSLGISKGDAEESFNYAVKWEHTAKANPNTVWGFVHGLTRFSQTAKYTDERHRLDSAGGKLLQLAYKPS